MSAPAVPQDPAADARQMANSSIPLLRESARAYLAGLGGAPQARVPQPPGQVREARDHSDPWMRASLAKSLAGPEPGVSGSVRVLTWGTGPDGRPGWQAPQPATPGLQIAAPGTAGR